MALVQPTNLFPSSFRGGGGDVIDASVANTFSLQLNGSSPCVAYQIIIMRNDVSSTTIYAPAKVILDTPIYPRDHLNEPQRLEIPVPTVSGLANGYANGYKWRVLLWWDSTNYLTSADTFFKCEATPYFTVVNPPSTVTAKSVTLTATYTQADGVPLEWYRWTMEDSRGNVVADTGEIFSEDIQITVDGLLNGESFTYKVVGQTQSGVDVGGAPSASGSNEGSFDVEYSSPVVQGEASLNCDPKTGSIMVSFPRIRIITGTGTGTISYVTDTPVEGETSLSASQNASVVFNTVNGESMSFPPDATHVWSGYSDSSATLYSFTEATASGTKRGVLSRTSSGYITYSYNGQTVLSILTGSNTSWIVAIMYKDTITMQLWEYSSLFPSPTLYPSNSILPDSGSGWRRLGRYTEDLLAIYVAGDHVAQLSIRGDNLSFTFIEAGEYQIAFRDPQGVPIAAPVNGSRTAGEVVTVLTPTTDPYYLAVQMYDAGGRFLGMATVRMNWPAEGEGSPSPAVSLTQVSMSGQLTANYIKVVEGTLSPEQKETMLDVYHSDADEIYDAKTLILAKFNGSLDGGSYSTGGETIVGWDIYKQKTGASNLQFVVSVPSSQAEVKDCLVENGQEYTYYLFPQGLSTMGSPIVSAPVSSNAWNWVLFTAEEGESNGLLTVKSAYVFQGNVETGSISNNAQSNVMQNFTAYPKIIKGTQNYRTGKLSALVGYVDTNGNTYTETAALREAMMDLSTSQDRMFLKNRAGDMWEVSVHEPVSLTVKDISPNQPHTASIEWTEVGTTNGISLIGESGV